MIWVLPQVAFRAKGRAWNTDYRKEWRCRWSGFPITRSVLFDRRRRHSFTAKMTLKAVQIPIGNNTTNPAIPIIHRPKDRKPRRRKNSTILVSTSILSGTDLRGIGVAWLTYWTVAFAPDGLQTLRLVENVHVALLPISTDHTPIIDSSAFAYTPQETTKIRPDLPEEEITVGSTVLARKKNLRWQRGQIVEVVTKGGEQFRPRS